MNEDVLYTLQRQPDPAFARTLRDRLGSAESARAPRLVAWPVRRLALAAVAIAIVVAGFTVPAVRASAESFLALFRVTRVVGVPVAKRDAPGLTATQLDLPHLIDRNVQTILDPGPPLDVVSIDQASSTAGYQVAQPTILPEGTTLEHIRVQGARAARVTVDVDPVNEGLRALGIRDIELPRDIDGGIGFIRTRPIVGLVYHHARSQVTVLQTPTPEITMPAGVQLPQLGEIALRIVGLTASDAHRMAQQIDWRSTLLVPVPPGADSFRQVDINGREGVLIITHDKTGSLVLWPGADRVFALAGPLDPAEALQMAQSIR